MSEFIIQYEISIRLSLFFCVFGLMAFWEVMAPRRVLTMSRTLRWANNLGLVLLNNFVLRLIFPAAAVGFAAFSSGHGWGLLNYFDLPFWFTVCASVIALDLAIYLQHVLVHAIPLLWRLHRVHHADLDYDLTTGARFHPIEIIFSMLVKLAAIVLIGPPIMAVIIFEVVLNAMAMFNHGNVKLPGGLDGLLRILFVTPDMHRVHHSVEDNEANSNFGFNLSFWDRLFGTYIDQPRGGHIGMRIGIHRYRDPKQVAWLPGMLLFPFIGRVTGYAINRREWSDADDK